MKRQKASAGHSERRMGVPASCLYVNVDDDHLLSVLAIPLTGTPLGLTAGYIAPDVDPEAAWRDAVAWWCAETTDDADRREAYAAFVDVADLLPLIIHVRGRTWGEPT
jgi:hypothetical protein